MRTTLAIDDDVIAIARQMAARQHKSLGEIISDLARKAIRPQVSAAARNGVPLLPNRELAPPVTMALVNELRDEGSASK